MQSQCDAAVLDLQSELRSDGRTVDLDIVLSSRQGRYRPKSWMVSPTPRQRPPAKLKVVKDWVQIEDVIGRGKGKAEIRDVIPIPGEADCTLKLLEISSRFRAVENRVEIDRAVMSEP